MRETLIFSKNNKIPNNKKKLFIGKWVLPYKKKIKKYRVLRYEKKISKVNKKDRLIKKIYIRILKNLTPTLNKIHREDYKENEWELLIYFFLYNYVYYSYDRWEIINSLKKNKLDTIEIFSFPKNYFLEHDTSSFYDLFILDRWDDWLFSKIIKAQNLNFIEKKINLKKKKQREFNNLSNLKTHKLLFPTNNNKYFIKSVSLPKYIKLKLNLKLNQNIRFPNSLNFKRYGPLSLKRNLLEKIQTKDKFEKFIYDTLPEVFPINYIENFEFIKKNIDYLNWPKNPKVIFTSFEHYINDVFKVYAMQKKAKGAKLHLMQHGHQRLNSSCMTSFVEQRISDKYFTWGAKSKNKNAIPLFCSTTVGKKVRKKSNKDILLSYTEFYTKPWKNMPLPRSADETDIYKNDIIDTVNYLINDQKNKIFLKYNSNSTKIDYITKELKQRFKKLHFIKTDLKKRGFEYSDKFKLNIETVNSTGFIELLSLNIPVILITNKNFFDVKKDYKKYFNALVKSNIIFFDTKKASDFIKKNIDKLDDWWFDKFTQNKINYFCNNVCKFQGELDKGFDKIFNEIR